MQGFLYTYTHLPLGTQVNRIRLGQSVQLHSLLLIEKYLETLKVLNRGANCSPLHIFSSGLGTGKGSVKLQNY
jgi:hypothetical protein